MQNTENGNSSQEDIFDPLLADTIEVSFQSTLEDDSIEHLMDSYTRDIMDVLYSLADEQPVVNEELNPFNYQRLTEIDNINYIPLDIPMTHTSNTNNINTGSNIINRNIELFADLNYGLYIPYEELSPSSENHQFFEDVEQKRIKLHLKIPKISNSSINKLYKKLNFKTIPLETFDLVKSIIYSKLYELLYKSIIIKPNGVKTINIEDIQKAIQLTDNCFYNCF